ncbi:MAG: type II toxin-antitoxin system YoeB family toxin [Synergistaceae bacterium]|nr:type II toxin-antitoxin system YoeB family toxin [Synergistaceae bacterium]
MRKIWSGRSWDEYVAWQMEDRKTLRRIDEMNRLVYRMPDEDTIEISQCKNHYDD